MLNVAVLVSGGGTNLQAILDAKAAGALPHAKIALVLASKPGVYALERASKAGVPGIVVARKSYAAPEEYDAALLAALREHRIDVVVLAGKGHETYQDIAGVKHPFDEKVIVSELLEEIARENRLGDAAQTRRK